MAGTAAAMVHLLKYGGWRELAEDMGEQMAAQSLGCMRELGVTAVIPVPLSRTRLRERGFNQAELLAEVVAGICGWPIVRDVLIRHQHTRRQAQLSPRERLFNVSKVFSIEQERADLLADGHLVLVDDVLTTAATAQECVRVLCGAGARAVSVLTFARARPELPRRGI